MKYRMCCHRKMKNIGLSALAHRTYHYRVASITRAIRQFGNLYHVFQSMSVKNCVTNKVFGCQITQNVTAHDVAGSVALISCISQVRHNDLKNTGWILPKFCTPSHSSRILQYCTTQPPQQHVQKEPQPPINRIYRRRFPSFVSAKLLFAKVAVLHDTTNGKIRRPSTQCN